MIGSGGAPKARYTNASTVGAQHARDTWALAARERLIETAKVYHSVVTHQELADFVQERSLIRTDQRMQYWIGDVLGRVTRDCTRKGEPTLSALCVNAQGSVGEGYAKAIATHRGETVGDADEHAALERLECHRHFGADLPPGGGVPALTPQLQAKRSKARTSTAKSAKPSKAANAAPTPAQPAKPAAFCPVHFTQLPATGVCDLCE